MLLANDIMQKFGPLLAYNVEQYTFSRDVENGSISVYNNFINIGWAIYWYVFKNAIKWAYIDIFY